MAGQSRRHSLIEALVNISTGMILAFTISQVAHFGAPLIREYIWSQFVWELSVGSNIVMTILLTVVSILRSYIWRRIFNKYQLRK